MRQSAVLAAALALCFLGASAVPSYAEEPAPVSGPTAGPGDPFLGQTVPPGPVYVITPGESGGPDSAELPPPADPTVVEELVERDRQSAAPEPTPSRTTVTPTPSAAATPEPTPAVEVTGVAQVPPTPAGGDSSSTGPWLVAVGVVLALLVTGLGWLALRHLQGRRLEQSTGSAEDPDRPVP